MRGTVTVYSGDVRRPPLVDSPDVNHILVKDEFGDPILLLMRLTDGDIWGLSTKGDKDFNDNLIRYGFIKPANTNINDILNSGRVTV